MLFYIIHSWGIQMWSMYRFSQCHIMKKKMDSNNDFLHFLLFAVAIWSLILLENILWIFTALSCSLLRVAICFLFTTWNQLMNILLFISLWYVAKEVQLSDKLLVKRLINFIQIALVNLHKIFFPTADISRKISNSHF